MARTTIPLTNTQIKNAKPKEKKYKLYDGRGLYLLVLTNGSRLWRLKYRLNNKEKEYSIGTYPTISLLKAREKREELKRFINDGIDPNEKKQQDKKIAKVEKLKKENTFYDISQKWLHSYKSQVSENYHTRQRRALENYIYPSIKNTPIVDITRLDIIAILVKLKNKKISETAYRTAKLLNKIYKYAVTFEYTPHNIMADIELKNVLGKRKKKHYPTLTKETDIKGLLLSIDDLSAHYSTRMILSILPYLFVRSFNIRHMEWKEINFKTKEWTIPAHKMKRKTAEFILPLPHQAMTILKEIKKNALSSIYVFPSPIYKDRPLSDNTPISALRRMGYTKEELVIHSFRSIFSTIAHEKANEEDGHGLTSEVIEALLAHLETNKVKAAYNHANYNEAKRKLIQWYADYLDNIKTKNYSH